MGNGARGALAYCGVTAVLSLGCGDGGAGGPKAASDMNKPDPMSMLPAGDAGAMPDAGGETPAVATFEEACVNACRAQASCLGFSDSDCTSACGGQAQVLPESCLEEATAEQQCLAGLTCDQAMSYGTQGRRQHAMCGPQATAYFAACTYDDGKTPPECAALCARYEACGVAGASAPACEERCILQNTGYQRTSAACGSSYLAFIGCGAQAECAEVKELAESKLSPVACNDELDAMDQACE